MKIISKYKDFYDYLVQDHDADITYVRQIGIVDKYYDDLFKRKENCTPYYNRYYGYSYGPGWGKHKDGDIYVSSYIFGVYPYVYSQPVINYLYTTVTDMAEWINVIPGADLTDRIISGKDCYPDIGKIVQDVLKSKYPKYPVKVNPYKGRLSEVMMKHTWKVDCEEIFYKINSPVFVKYYDDLFLYGVYYENTKEFHSPKDTNKIHYVTGISFQKLNQNILKYWYDDLNIINTYNDIENFLWSVKKEPVSNPDNKTRILSHGFDLKTSFRNVK